MTTTTTQTIGNRNFNTSANSPFGFGNGKWTATDNSDGYLGNYGANEDVTKTVTVPNGTSELLLKFDFLEVDSWDNEHLYVDINGVTVDLGAFHVYTTEGTHGWQTADDNITYRKTAASTASDFTNAGWVDQRHTYEIELPGSVVTDGQLSIKWHSSLNQASNDEAFGIDNFLLTATVLQADSNDYSDARSAIQEIDMFSIGSQQLGSLYDTFATRLELMKDGAFDLGEEMGLDLGNLTNSQVLQLETDATAALNTWSAANNGFDEWGELLWQEMYDQYGVINGNDGVDLMRGLSILTATAGFLTGGLTGAGALGIATTSLNVFAAFVEETGEHYPSTPIPLQTFTMDEALESLYSELSSRNFNSDAATLKTAADTAAQEMVDFMTNSQLANYVGEMMAGGVNRLSYKSKMEALGFDVDSGYHRADIGPGGPIGDSYSWMRIEDGSADIIGVDSIYFRYNGSTGTGFNYDIDFT
ncbi:hypothetical protein [Roseibium alexandrii]|uniref:Uncharacterized protein n=2 Tax=Roseibium alexandrii TaxID=388408 RepID=A0A5E8H519_ROSAD|nr:hypothetical protein [Roseibium alexandrii]EEE47704.1 hypothetical protein SADFL11_4993 [Roseibium alexandrii DFL-11]